MDFGWSENFDVEGENHNEQFLMPLTCLKIFLLHPQTSRKKNKNIAHNSNFSLY